MLALDDWVRPRRMALAWHREQGSLPGLRAFAAAAREAALVGQPR